MNVKQIAYLFILFTLSLASFWRVLTFGFWIDDWPLIWGSLYNISALFRFLDHPSSPILFFILSHIFGKHEILWYICLLLIRLVVSYFTGVFLYTLTKSKIAGFLAGIFFAVSYAGYEVVDTPSSSAPLIVSVLLLFSLIFFIRSLEYKNHSPWLFCIFLFTAFFLDPARAIPIFFIFPFLLLLLSKSAGRRNMQRFLTKFFLILCIIGTPLFIIYFLHFRHDSLISMAVKGIFHKQWYYLSKLNRFGNYFATIANLFIGIFYSLKQNEIDIAAYNRIVGRIGVLIFFTSLASFIFYIRKRSYQAGIIAFFIFWIFIFYLPNFFSEPRAPMAGPNRYLFLSSIGFVCLLAYLMSKIKQRWIVVVVSLVFVVANIYKANTLLAWQSSYRQAHVVNSMWETINQQVPNGETNDIFVITGQQPWLTQDIEFSQGGPYLLQRHMTTHYADFPIITHDENVILTYLCSKTTIPVNKKKYPKSQIPLSHIYSWKVTTPGVLMNVTMQERKHLESLAKIKNCKLVQ